MIEDYKLAFSLGQAVTVTADSEYILDSEYAYPNLGKGGDFGVYFVVTTTFTVGTSMSFGIFHGLASADTEMYTTPVVLEAVLVAGYNFFLPYTSKVMRFRKIVYTVDGTHSTGKIYAFEGFRQGQFAMGNA